MNCQEIKTIKKYKIKSCRYKFEIIDIKKGNPLK